MEFGRVYNPRCYHRRSNRANVAWDNKITYHGKIHRHIIFNHWSLDVIYRRQGPVIEVGLLIPFVYSDTTSPASFRLQHILPENNS